MELFEPVRLALDVCMVARAGHRALLMVYGYLTNDPDPLMMFPHTFTG